MVAFAQRWGRRGMEDSLSVGEEGDCHKLQLEFGVVWRRRFLGWISAGCGAETRWWSDDRHQLDRLGEGDRRRQSRSDLGFLLRA